MWLIMRIKSHLLTYITFLVSEHLFKNHVIVFLILLNPEALTQEKHFPNINNDIL